MKARYYLSLLIFRWASCLVVVRSADENERFDADFVLMTSELATMLDDIVYALGGELAEPIAA